MKILIDGQTLLTPEIDRGIGKYFTNTVEHILAADFTNDFYINTPDCGDLKHFSPWAREKLLVIPQDTYNNRETFYNLDVSTARYSDDVNRAIEETKIDLYWSPNGLMSNVFLPVRKTNRCRFAVTIFDLIPAVMEQHFEKHWRAETFAQYKRKLALLESDYDLYLHISEHTQADFTNMLRVSQKQHVVTPLAADNSFHPYPFPKVVDVKDYVLYPGGFDPRKNMERALEAFAELHKQHGNEQEISKTSFLIVCNFDAVSESEVRQRARTLGIGDKVELAGFVSDAEMVALYQKARCLFFPSLYEGFGLPVLEGLACGLPVAASNRSAIPEVAGNLALYFDPLDVKEMAEVLYQALIQPVDFASRLKRFNHARQFSWRNTALATLKAFADCANGAT